MKQCLKCKRSLDVSQFHRSLSRGRQAVCKECKRVMDADRHANKASLRRTQSKAIYRKNTQLIRKLKDEPCSDCGNKFHFSAMQFDHRPGEKKLFNVSDGNRRNSINKLLAEVAKCDLVCANCHAVRTWNRRKEQSLPYVD